MDNYPNIESLLKLTEEIEHLKEAEKLLLEVLFVVDRGIPLDSVLRMRINDHFSINEDE